MAFEGSYSVAQVARSLGVTAPTIRNWSAVYARFLSPQATPAPDEERQYDADDLAVLMTVKTLRGQRVKHPAIVQRLAAGERLEPPDAPPPPPRASSGRIVEQPPAPAGDVVRALTLYQGQVESLTERLIAAEIARTAAETELRLLRERMSTIVDREPPAPAADAPAVVDDAPVATPLTLGDAIRGWWQGRKK